MSGIDIVPVSIKNVGLLETINKNVLDVKYNKKFYREAAENFESGYIAYYQGIPVGATVLSFDQKGNVYVRTLAVLKAYRKKNVGKKLMQVGETIARERGVALTAHVWSENAIALKFYTQLGFETEKLLEKYYHALDPPSAWLISKRAW